MAGKQRASDSIDFFFVQFAIRWRVCARFAFAYARVRYIQVFIQIKVLFVNSRMWAFTCIGRGGAGRGGGCFAFFGGSAGLGDSGRGGGPDFDPKLEPIAGFGSARKIK